MDKFSIINDEILDEMNMMPHDKSTFEKYCSQFKEKCNNCETLKDSVRDHMSRMLEDKESQHKQNIEEDQQFETLSDFINIKIANNIGENISRYVYKNQNFNIENLELIIYETVLKISPSKAHAAKLLGVAIKTVYTKIQKGKPD